MKRPRSTIRKCVAASLLFFNPISISAAFSPNFTTPVQQCGPFNLSWVQEASSPTAPPYTLILLPVNITRVMGPRILPLPNEAWDNVAMNGHFTLDTFAIPAGTQFIVAMDDLFGLGRGGVSTIQTVAPSQDTACLIPAAERSPLPSSVFNISNTSPGQCDNIQITTAEKPLSIRGFVPGGTAFSLDIPANAPATGPAVIDWTVNVPSGTSFVLLVQLPGNITASTGVLNAGPGQSSSCLQVRGVDPLPSSTVALPSASTAPSSALPGLSQGRTAAIVGGIVGGLGLVALVAISIFFIALRGTDANPFKGGMRSVGSRSSRGGRPTAKSSGGHGMRAWPGFSIAETQNSRTAWTTDTTEETRVGGGSGNGIGTDSRNMWGGVRSKASSIQLSVKDERKRGNSFGNYPPIHVEDRSTVEPEPFTSRSPAFSAFPVPPQDRPFPTTPMNNTEPGRPVPPSVRTTKSSRDDENSSFHGSYDGSTRQRDNSMGLTGPRDLKVVSESSYEDLKQHVRAASSHPYASAISPHKDNDENDAEEGLLGRRMIGGRRGMLDASTISDVGKDDDASSRVPSFNDGEKKR